MQLPELTKKNTINLVAFGVTCFVYYETVNPINGLNWPYYMGTGLIVLESLVVFEILSYLMLKIVNYLTKETLEDIIDTPTKAFFDRNTTAGHRSFSDQPGAPDSQGEQSNSCDQSESQPTRDAEILFGK